VGIADEVQLGTAGRGGGVFTSQRSMRG
jgi:hypothetical protein